MDGLIVLHSPSEVIMLCFTLSLKVVASFLESLFLICGKFSTSFPLIFKHKWLCAYLINQSINQSVNQFLTLSLIRTNHGVLSVLF